MLNLLGLAFLEQITFASVMSKIGSILLAFVVLLFMITVHELGHYTAGRLLNFKINEFMIGFGPKLFSRKNEKRDEIFSLRLLPLGGGCVFEGEDEDNTNPQAFNNQKPWKRIIVLISGALFNFICALIIAFIFFSAFGEHMAVITKVEENSPNYGEGFFETGDVIVSVNGRNIYLISDISEIINKAKQPMTVVVFRPYEQYIGEKLDSEGNPYLAVDITSLKNGEQGQLVTIEGVTTAVFYTNEEMTESYTGWGITRSWSAQRVKIPFFTSIGRSFGICFETGTLVIKTLGRLLTGAAGLNEVGGPITIIDQASQVVQSGFANVLYLIILISVNLAVFNLLPIPALDGMRVVFVLIEMIFKKPVNRKVEAIIHFAGIIFLLGFAILVDVLKWF